ncbi:type VII secretion protein EccE [Mycobacterium sp. CPCC 205372]|uniref:Type VII secretion protein EccE n=1 Tax=Mycobacterium hippophais TaxID=3016340 RepID=A0ABT4PUL8_9MYCO|nr:type VII secretion protein EccE [Mycobacterium hippophais]MCZ8380184.1 type VII secretion protein EccE [Mycobacterium hippophais]
MATAVAPSARPTTPDTPPPLRASRRIGPQRRLPLSHLLVTQVLATAGLVVWQRSGWPWWACALGVVVGCVATVGRWHGTTLPGAVAARLDHRRQRRRRRDQLDVPHAFDHFGSDEQRYGFRWDGRTLLTVLEIDDVPDDLTILDAGKTVSGAMVPLDILADCLTQFDIDLDSIDLISHGARSHGHTPVAAVYDAVLGPLPAIAHRTVRVVVRLDPSRCPRAVALRGGGRAGLVRTAMVATRRVANRLTESGLRVQVLSAADIGRAVGQLCDGVNLSNLREEWTHCADGNFRLTSFALDGTMLSTHALGRVWTVPSYSTTIALTMRNGGTGSIAVTGVARFDTFGEIDPDRLSGLSALPGRQFRAILASLPFPRPARDLTPWFYAGDSADFAGIHIPAAGCGQVIGADAHGRAVALPVFGPQIDRVEIAGSLQLVQQVVLRALAIGARILVHTNRSARWRDLVTNVDDSRLLWVADFNRGALQAGSDRNFSVMVFDGVPESTTRVGMTAIVVTAPGAAVSGPADVTLRQRREDTTSVEVTTRSVSAVVTMVATDDEMRFIAPVSAR